MGQRLEHTSSKKIQRWQISIWKDASHHMSHRKCKLKQQWDTTTPTRMPKIWNTDKTKWWWVCRATRTLINWWSKCKMVQPLWKTVWWFLTKLNTLLPYSLAIVLLGIYPKELKTYVHTKTCTHTNIYSKVIQNCPKLEANKIVLQWENG